MCANKTFIEIPLKGVVDCSAAKNKCIIIVQKIKSKSDSKWKKFYPVHNEIQCDHIWEKANYATKLNIDIFKNIYFVYKIMNMQS